MTDTTGSSPIALCHQCGEAAPTYWIVYRGDVALWFCNRCYTKQEKENFCSKCGQELPK